MSTEPPSPLPPQSLPPQATAIGRLQALRDECDAAGESPVAAVAWFELGALYEHGLGHPDEAQQCYRRAYKLDGTFAPSLMALERICAGMPDYARLARVLEARHTVAEDARLRAQLLTEHAIVLSDQLGELERAEAQLESALSEDPSCQEAALMLEHQWTSRGQREGAMLVVEARAGQVGDPALRANLLCEAATSQRQSGALPQAVTLLEDAAQLSHGRFMALRNRHVLALERDDVDGAIDALSNMLALSEGFARSDGRAVEEDNAPLGRFQTLDQARQACCAMAYELYAHQRYGRGDMESARAALLRALGHSPLPALSAEYAELCAQTGHVVEAERTALHALDDAQGTQARVPWLFRLAEAHLLAGDTGKAADVLQQAYSEAPGSPALAATLVRLLAMTGQWNALVSHLLARAAHAPDDRPRLLARAAYVAAELVHNEALTTTLLEDSCKAEPLAGLAVARMAYVAARQQGWPRLESEALRFLASAAPAGEERTFFSFLEFYTDFKDGVPSAQMAPYLAREELRPWAPSMLRVLSAARDDHALLAASHGQLATIATEPSQRSAHHTCAARAFVLCGDEDAAERHLRSALSHQSDNAYALSLLCLLHEQRGEDLSAMALLRESARQQGDARVAALRLLQAGVSAERAGEPKTALRHFSEAVTCDPDLMAAHFAQYGVAVRLCVPEAQYTALSALAVRGFVENVELDLAELCDRAGDDLAADDHAKQALTRSENEAYAALRLALCGTTDDAAALGQEYLARHLIPTDLWLDGSYEPGPGAPVQDQALSRTLHAAQVLSSPSHEEDHASGWFSLASACQTDGLTAELQLLAVHCAMIGGGAETAAETIVLALNLHATAPDQEAAAIALDDAVSPSDDPELRKLALLARLEHNRDAAQDRSLSRHLAFAQLDDGDTDAALSAARHLTADDRDDVPALVLLRAAALQAQSHADVVLANDLLIRYCPTALAAELLVEAADCLKLHLVDSIGAELRLRRALALDPLSADAFDRLHDLLLERNDGTALLDLLESHLRVQSDENTAQLHYDAARLCNAANKHPDAVRHLQRVLQFVPLHVGALSLLANAEHESGNPRGAVDALKRLAQAELPPAQRRLVRLGAADFLVAPLEDTLGALVQLRALHEEGLALAEDSARLAELAAELGMLDEAVGAYRRGADQVHGARRCQWLRAAGRLLERDPERLRDAIATYRDALSAVPTDRASHTALYRLMPSQTERLLEAAQFLSAIQDGLTEHPLDIELLRGMRVAGHHGAMSFVEYAALSALSALEASDHAEETARQLLAHHRATELKRSPLSDEGLALLRASSDGGPLARLAELCSELLGDLLEDPRRALGRRERKAKGPLRDKTLPAELAVLGLTLRHLYTSPEAQTPIRLCPAKSSTEVDVIVSGAVKAPLTPMVRFRLGTQACAHRTGTLLLSGVSPAERRRALIALVMAAELFEVQNVPDDTEDLAKEMNRRMPRRMRRELQDLGPAVQKAFRQLDAYMAGAETTRLRGGLIQCDTLGPALAATGVSPGHITSSPEAVALLRFWTSARAVALHGESLQGTLQPRSAT